MARSSDPTSPAPATALLVAIAVALSLLGAVAPAMVGAATAGATVDPASSNPAVPAPSGPPVALVVQRSDGVGGDAVTAALAGTAATATDLPNSGATRVVVPRSQQGAVLARLGRTVGVRSALADPVAHATSVVPNDPAWGAEWGARSADLPAAWSTTTGAAATVIAVVDTGVSASPELAGRLLPGIDLVNHDNDASDDNGHGSAVATVAAAAGNDGIGMAGACWSCRILPVKVLDGSGSGSLAVVADGIEWAIAHGANVVNLSLGSSSDIPELDRAVADARAANVVVVAAAGNAGTSSRVYPGATAGVVSVAGTDANAALQSWSTWGSWVDVAAPGCNVADGRGNLDYSFCGTSSASPMVAGIVGLLRSHHPDAAAPAVAAAIEGSTRPLITTGRTAHGLVDAAAALAALDAGLAGNAVGGAPLTGAAPGGSIEVRGPYLSGQVPIRVTTAGPGPVDHVDVIVDGAVVGSAGPGTDGVAVVVWNSSTVQDGPVSIGATVVAPSGQSGPAGEIGAIVDNAGPTVTVVDPSPSRVVTGAFPVRIGATAPLGVKLTLIAAGGRWVGAFGGSATVTVSVPVTGPGSIRIAAVSVDGAGRLGVSNVVVVTSKARASRSRTVTKASLTSRRAPARRSSRG